MSDTVDFSFIVLDNESAVKASLDRGDYLQAFLLIHTVVESLLRAFLSELDEYVKFSALVDRYEEFLAQRRYPVPTFVEELRQFNRRRNRIVHQLWRKGYSFTNRQTEDAARAALIVYGLFIEFLETFDPEITKRGFTYENS